MSPQTQRNLNNAFAYDLVPSPNVIAAALKAARRVNDFPTAVRVFEGEHPSHEATPSPQFASQKKHNLHRLVNH